MSFELGEIDRRLAVAVQAGTIEAVDHAAARCRVRIDDWVSAWLPWSALAAGQVRHWRPPSVGEQAVIVSPSGEAEAGFVLPGFYTDQHAQAHDNRQQTTSWLFPDGTLVEYDHQKKRALVDCVGDIEVIAAGHVHIDARGPIDVRTDASAEVFAAGDVKVRADGNAEVRAKGWMQVIASGRLLVKSLSQLILKGPSRTLRL